MDFSKMEIGCRSHYLDSGSFSLWTKAAEYAKATGSDKWAFYHTSEFWEYVDAYAAFVITNQVAIDLYSNVDVIPNPKLTWRSQEYLEDNWLLQPVPVVHYKTDLKWLRFYFERGYKIIALGGLVGSTAQEACRTWLDRAFQTICDKDGLPRVKIHGFGVTSYDLLLRYPWWSVDSSSWTKVGAFGGILVPHKRAGKFCFTEQPYLIKVALDSPDAKKRGKHINTINKAESAVVREWLEKIGVPLGKMAPDGEVLELGVTTRHCERKAANILFFEAMRKSLPKWPWPFKGPRKFTFGLI